MKRDLELLRHEWPTDREAPLLCVRCGAALMRDVGFCPGALLLLLTDARMLQAIVELYVNAQPPDRPPEPTLLAHAKRILAKLHAPFYRSSSDVPVATGGTRRWQVSDETPK